MQSKYSRRLCIFVTSVATAALMLGGCSDGTNGANGTNGADGTIGGTSPVNITALSAEDQAKLTLKGEVTGVTINSPPVVNFKVTDGNGNPLIGLGIKNAAGTALNNMGFALAKLVSGTNGSPNTWVSYIVTTTATPALGQRPSTDTDGALIDNGDGSYQYTFKRDITAVKAVVAGLTDSGNNRKADLGDLTYDPALTHRLAIQIGGNILNTSPSIPFKNPVNIIYDFIPATGKVVTATDTQREIVTIAACNECHGKLAFHGGGARVEAKFCVMCHNSQRAYGNPKFASSIAGVFPPATKDANGRTIPYVADGEVTGDFVTMVHKIHQGNKLSKTGYDYAGVKFDKLGYPQDQGNCRKCHKAEASAQGDNWNLKPSRQACGACHDGINWLDGTGSTVADAAAFNGQKIAPGAIPVAMAKTGHAGGSALVDSGCVLCHGETAALSVKKVHMGVNKTPNNPETLAGLVNFTYDINSASVTTNNDLTIKFRILGDGTPVTLAAPAAGLTVSLANFTGSPSFLLAYTQSSVNQPMTIFADYNNLGKVAGQPATVSITNLLNTNNALTTGNIAGPDASGYYTATILSAAAFPVGAKLRAVGLQGYYTQVSPAAARHTVSVIKAVTGDAVRRTVVDSAKCGNCHEWFEGHGGNRVYEVQLCVTCHNPNLSTSGRTTTDAKLSVYAFTAIQKAILLSWDPAFNQATVGYSLTFPEFTNNFKELIHGIHAGKDRTNPLRDARNGSQASITLINAGEFAFPGILKNCDSCHVTPTGPNKQTWKADLPAGVLATTNVTRDANGEASIAFKLAARSTVPNLNDVVSAPLIGACVSCHDSAVAKAHMNSNGGQLGAALTGPSYTDLGVARTNLQAAEQCALCHGEGKVADVVKVHAK